MNACRFLSCEKFAFRSSLIQKNILRMFWETLDVKINKTTYSHKITLYLKTIKK